MRIASLIAFLALALRVSVRRSHASLCALHQLRISTGEIVGRSRQSRFTLGCEAFWQRLWQNDRTAIRWNLIDRDGTTWSAEQRHHHVPAGARIGRRAASIRMLLAGRCSAVGCGRSQQDTNVLSALEYKRGEQGGAVPWTYQPCSSFRRFSSRRRSASRRSSAWSLISTNRIPSASTGCTAAIRRYISCAICR